MLKTVVSLLALALCGADLLVLRARAELVNTGCGSTCTEHADCTYTVCGGTIGLENPEKIPSNSGTYFPAYKFSCNNPYPDVDKGNVGRCQYQYQKLVSVTLANGKKITELIPSGPLTICPISVMNADCASPKFEADGAEVEPLTSGGASHYCLARWLVSLLLVAGLFLILICFC